MEEGRIVDPDTVNRAAADKHDVAVERVDRARRLGDRLALDAEGKGRPLADHSAVGQRAVRTPRRADEDKGLAAGAITLSGPLPGKSFNRVRVERNVVVEPEIAVRLERQRTAPCLMHAAIPEAHAVAL